MNLPVPASWRAVIDPVFAGPHGQRLVDFLEAEAAAGKQVFPPRSQWLHALELTPLDQVKIVILGQDPYHGPGQAHGLSFSVPDGVRLPPSLANIYKELESDCGIVRRSSGNLEHWARQGVLLLNTALTVEAGKAGSHAGQGWEAVTDAIVAAVAQATTPSVFILWGNHARKKAARIPALRDGPHLVLESAHPSPLSAYNGFFGSRPFSRANAFLRQVGRQTIDW